MEGACKFFSIEQQDKRFTVDDVTITYNNGEIHMSHKSNWKHLATLSYSITEASKPEINIVNNYKPLETEKTVSKGWKDNENQDGVRPKEVTIKLLADGKETGKKLVLSQKTNWNGTFTDLDVYKDGKKIVYTVVEEKVGHRYTSTVTGNAKEGFIVTNSRTPDKVNPETGDTFNIAMNTSLTLLALSILITMKKRKNIVE